eukprot:100424_1
MSVDTTDVDASTTPIEAMNIDKDNTDVNKGIEPMEESTTDQDNDTPIEDLTSSTPSNGHTDTNPSNPTDTKPSIDIDSNQDIDSQTLAKAKQDEIQSQPTTDDSIETTDTSTTKNEEDLEEDIEEEALPNGSHDTSAMEEDDDDDRGKVRKIGYDDNGVLMPGFEDVNDDELAFSSESDFAIFIKQISSEIPLQRLVAVKRMMKSCKLWGLEAVLSVLPRVKQLSCDKEMVIRQAIAEVVGPFAKYLIETGGQNAVIINELLPLIREMLMDAMEVRQGAGASLIVIAELLNKEQVYEHILKIVLHMAHDDSDDQKITALPLLGDLAPIVGSAVCKNYLSADLHALSQDNSFRVRKATVQYFGPICAQLSSEECSECLLPIFLHLCSDSIWSVRKGCVESFVDVSCSIAAEERVQLMPIMEKFLNDSSRWVRNTAYEMLGGFISTLSSSQISADFLHYFTSIPHLSSAEADADCTNHCAFNFPAVVLTVGRERWSELGDTYAILCRKTFKSRKTLACSIHEIAAVLGTELTEEYLLNSIEFFLKDIDDIRCGIIRNLWKILSVFSSKLRCEYVSILWELASESDVNWRFRLLLAQQLDEILHLYGAQTIRQQIIPLIFELCQDRMADVRYAAVYPIADAINLLCDDSIDDIRQRIQSIYGGRTYSKRLLYIRIADSCFNRIPRTTFDDLFAEDLCRLAEDAIFNVRYCVARFIHKNDLHNAFESVIRHLKENEEEDIEIKRFFCTPSECEEWLRHKQHKQATATKPIVNNHKQMARQLMPPTDDNNSPDSTDSSLYSSSDEDSLSQSDDDESPSDDQLGDELQSVADNLNSIHKQMEQEKGLTHQDTPFVLNISKELQQEIQEIQNQNDDDDDDQTQILYGVKINKNHETKEEDAAAADVEDVAAAAPADVDLGDATENAIKTDQSIELSSSQ